MPNEIIDVHTHPVFPSFVSALKLSEESGDMPLPGWSLEQHLALMDEHGIDRSILSVNSVANALVGPNGRARARELSEDLAALIAKNPRRFAAFAIVPMDDADAALAEMEYALDTLGFAGVTCAPHFRGKYLGEPEYDRWFEEMNRRGVTLFVHPTGTPEFNPKESRMNVSVLDFMFDTTRMVTTLVLSGAKARFDKINLIATHGGGTIPFLATRIQLVSQMPWAFRDGPKMKMDEVRAALTSFYFDLTAAVSPTSLNAIRDLIPPEQLLLGFDFPFMPPQTIAPALKSFAAYQGFDAAQKKLIARENALRLFPQLSKAA